MYKTGHSRTAEALWWYRRLKSLQTSVLLPSNMQMHKSLMLSIFETLRLQDGEKMGAAVGGGLNNGTVEERRESGAKEREASRDTHKGDYLSCVTQRIGLKMSLSSGTNLSMLSGVPRRLPTMLCCSVATPSVGVKFLHKTRARKRMAAYYSQPCPYVPCTNSDGQHNLIWWLMVHSS